MFTCNYVICIYYILAVLSAKGVAVATNRDNVATPLLNSPFINHICRRKKGRGGGRGKGQGKMTVYMGKRTVELSIISSLHQTNAFYPVNICRLYIICHTPQTDKFAIFYKFDNCGI